MLLWAPRVIFLTREKKTKNPDIQMNNSSEIIQEQWVGSLF